MKEWHLPAQSIKGKGRKSRWKPPDGHQTTGWPSEKKRAASAWSPYLHSNLQGCTERNEGCPHQPWVPGFPAWFPAMSLPLCSSAWDQEEAEPVLGQWEPPLGSVAPSPILLGIGRWLAQGCFIKSPITSLRSHGLWSPHFTETQSTEVNCQRDRGVASRFTDFQGSVHPTVAITIALIPKAFEYSIISFNHEMNLYINSQGYMCLSNYL